MVDLAFMRAREPHVAAHAALWSPATGRVEAEALVSRARAQGRRGRRDAAARRRMLEGSPTSHGFDVRFERETISARTVVNAAGLYADDVSRALAGEAFTIYPVRGEYAELRGPDVSG